MYHVYSALASTKSPIKRATAITSKQQRWSVMTLWLYGFGVSLLLRMCLLATEAARGEGICEGFPIVHQAVPADQDNAEATPCSHPVALAPTAASLGSGHHQPSARGEKVHGRFSQPGKVETVPAREQAEETPKRKRKTPTSHRGAAPSDRRRGTEWIEDENTAAVAVSMPTLADRAFVKLLAAAVSETACLNRNASCWPSIWRLDSTLW